MTNTFLQIVITIWLGVHPVTVTLPHLYPVMQGDVCDSRLGEILRHRKNNKLRMELACVPTDKRPA